MICVVKRGCQDSQGERGRPLGRSGYFWGGPGEFKETIREPLEFQQLTCGVVSEGKFAEILRKVRGNYVLLRQAILRKVCGNFAEIS